MKKYFCLYLFLVFYLNMNSQEVYSSCYKYVNLSNDKVKIDPKSQITDSFLESLVYNFYSSSQVNYLGNTSFEGSIGINAKVSGDQNIFINFIDGNVIYDLDENTPVKFKMIKFKKVPNSNLEILKFKVSKYISDDGNLIIYTTKFLPWYVQPGIFNSNQINESVVRFENIKKNYGLELIKFEKLKSNKEFKVVEEKILKKKYKLKSELVLCPFFKT